MRAVVKFWVGDPGFICLSCGDLHVKLAWTSPNCEVIRYATNTQPELHRIRSSTFCRFPVLDVVLVAFLSTVTNA